MTTEKELTLIDTNRERRKLFVKLFSSGATAGNATQSAAAAGYSIKTARQQGSRLTKDLAVDIQQAVAHNITLSAPTALLTMMSIMKDDTVADSVRLQAARDVLDRSGYGATNRIEISSQLDSKSDEELRVELRQLMNNVIDVTPDDNSSSE